MVAKAEPGQHRPLSGGWRFSTSPRLRLSGYVQRSPLPHSTTAPTTTALDSITCGGPGELSSITSKSSSSSPKRKATTSRRPSKGSRLGRKGVSSLPEISTVLVSSILITHPAFSSRASAAPSPRDPSSSTTSSTSDTIWMGSFSSFHGTLPKPSLSLTEKGKERSVSNVQGETVASGAEVVFMSEGGETSQQGLVKARRQQRRLQHSPSEGSEGGGIYVFSAPPSPSSTRSWPSSVFPAPPPSSGMRSAFDAPINVGPLSSLGMDDIDDAISLAHNEEDSHQGFNLRCAAHQRPDTTFLLEKRAALPSSYPSSIASSWSKPPRSVWFQQKAIIVTSIFLAIFIVLFIGAAVFLRDRNLDVDEYDESDEAQVERMRNERRQAGMRLDGGGGGGNDDGEKDVDQRRSRKKRKNARRSSKESERGVVANGSRDNSEKDPSTGSSSALNRGRHLVSRWTRMSSRKPLLVRDTTGMSDSGSIRSTRSGRRLALGHPTSSSDEVVHSSNEETSRDISGSQGTQRSGSTLDGSSALAPAEQMRTSAESSRSQRSLRPPATPPPSGPHLTETVSSQGRSDGSEASSSRGRVVLDDSDFRAAEEAEEARRALNVMPPAYIPSNTRGRSSGGISGASPDGLTTIQDADLDAAVAHGDLKRGIPPPTDRDEDVSRELIRTALLDSGGYLGEGGSGQAGDTSLHAGHIATDEKATLNAITAAATSPDGLARHHRSAPAYADGEPSNPAAGVSAHEAGSPSAPVLSDEEDFELHGGPVGGQDHAEATTGSSRLTLPLPGIPSTDASEWPKEKGKGKSSTSGSRSSFLPEPPKPVDPTFSPFDQPYQPVWPPRISSSFSSSGQIRSSSRPDPTAPVASRHDSSLEVTSAAQDREPSRSSEKQRMAELELGLVSSSPADLLDTSSGHGGMVEDLPAYQKDSSHSHVSQPTAPDDSDDTAEEGALSPSMESNPSGVPSAPPNLDALEEEEIEYADGVPP